MQLRSDNFEHGQPIPPKLAFAKRAAPVALSDNLSPHLAWKEAPLATRSFVLTCIDFDVPSKPDDVNQEGRSVPADLPRVEFVHWLMANIPAECGELAAGACSGEITPRGKREPFGPPGSVQGVNEYTGWFAGDAEMGGEYLGYDGPCPPWRDSTAAMTAPARHGTTPWCITTTSAFTPSTWSISSSPMASPSPSCVERWTAMCWPRRS